MTEPFLEQGQIDQLIEAIDQGKVPTQPDALLSARNAHLLDLSDPTWSQDRVIRRPLPVLNLVFGRLGPSVQVTLTKSLRSPVRVEGTSLELQKFGEFRRQLGDARTLFEMIRLDPLAGISMLVMAPTITYSLIDALMGGRIGTDGAGADGSGANDHFDILAPSEVAVVPPVSVEHIAWQQVKLMYQE